MPTRDPRLAGHVPSLDGVRGVAILSVLFFHTAQQAHVTGPLALVAGFGWAGVDLFFALSGFLITGILLDSRERPDYYRRFYVRRARRIFPLYIGYIGVLAAMQPGGWVLWYATYLLNVQVAVANSWAPALAGTAFFWSLCVEEQFYAVWPFVVRRVTARRLAQCCAGMIAAAVLWRVSMVATGHLFAAYVLLLGRMDGLALGALAAILVREPDGLDRFARRAPMTLALAGVGLVALIGRTHYAGWDQPGMASVGYSLTALAGVSLLILAVAHGWRWTRWTWLRYAGRRCYGLYVLGGLGSLLAHALGLPRWPEAAVSLALAVVLAEASWRWLEKPILEGVGHRAPVTAPS